MTHRIFDSRLTQLSEEHSRVSARYDLWYALNDWAAGLLFVVGSILFFEPETETAATWLFLIGSVLFTVRPTIRLVRDIHLRGMPPGESSTQQE